MRRRGSGAAAFQEIQRSADGPIFAVAVEEFDAVFFAAVVVPVVRDQAVAVVDVVGVYAGRVAAGGGNGFDSVGHGVLVGG